MGIGLKVVEEGEEVDHQDDGVVLKERMGKGDKFGLVDMKERENMMK